MINFADLQDRYEFDVFAKRGITIVRGSGALVWDSDGKEYIDCIAGHGVATVGHCNEAVAEAVARQAQKLITCGGSFYNDTKALLLEKLAGIVPIGSPRTFLCNSGTEAVEAGLKFARFTTGKSGFICAMRGFHGRTFGSMSATWQPKYKQEFEPVVPGFTFAPFNNFEKLEALVSEKTAAVLLEPVQGEGGVYPAEPEYLQKVSSLCAERQILLIIDEVQTGFCRTGKMFACECSGIKPDILCLGKAIAGGLPMGATVCSDKIDVPIGRHGTTFGGNPLACAAANAAIDFMTKTDLARRAAEKGVLLAEKLRGLDSPKIRDIRSIGLMTGVELKEKARPYINVLAENGVLALPAGATVLRLLPPAVIENEQIERVAEAIGTVL